MADSLDELIGYRSRLFDHEHHPTIAFVDDDRTAQTLAVIENHSFGARQKPGVLERTFEGFGVSTQD